MAIKKVAPIKTAPVPAPTAVQRLVERMLNFVPGTFDGYPSTSCTDEALIEEAREEYDRLTPCGGGGNSLTFLCFIASEAATTPEQYRAARDFVYTYVDAVWHCNMCEGSNPAHEEVCGERP